MAKNIGKAEVCKCNNCDTILFDENPKDDKQHDIFYDPEKEVQFIKEYPGKNIQRMEYIDASDDPTAQEDEYTDGEYYFWGCPNCRTDSYLMDIE